MITAEMDGLVLSASNCFGPFFFLMNEERDSTLSSAVPLLPATVNLPLKVTSLASRWLGEVVVEMEGGNVVNSIVAPPPRHIDTWPHTTMWGYAYFTLILLSE